MTKEPEFGSVKITSEYRFSALDDKWRRVTQASIWTGGRCSRFEYGMHGEVDTFGFQLAEDAVKGLRSLADTIEKGVVEAASEAEEK